MLFVPALAFGVSVVAPALSPAAPVANAQIREGVNAAQGSDQPGNLVAGNGSIFKRIVDILLLIIGAVAVIMLIFGGFKYVTSGGDASGVTAAKNTILYAIVGIVVAILAYAIVDFVVKEVANK